MSTTASLPNVQRSRIVAATGALVAAAAVTVTLAVANGGSDTPQGQPSRAPATSSSPAGTSGADQFHHFREWSPSAPLPPAASAGTSASDRFHHFR
jgi:hypothetical protein